MSANNKVNVTATGCVICSDMSGFSYHAVGTVSLLNPPPPAPLTLTPVVESPAPPSLLKTSTQIDAKGTDLVTILVISGVAFVVLVVAIVSLSILVRKRKVHQHAVNTELIRAESIFADATMNNQARLDQIQIDMESKVDLVVIGNQLQAPGHDSDYAKSPQREQSHDAEPLDDSFTSDGTGSFSARRKAAPQPNTVNVDLELEPTPFESSPARSEAVL